ncbi:MAG: methyl-accepting chemotaxis protein [Betaproteobacteria bacterium]
MAFKLPFKLGSRPAAGVPPAPASPRPAEAPAGSLLGGRNLRLVLVPVLVVLLLIAGVLVFVNARDSKHAALYIADAGQLRMLSQRLAKAAQQSLLGNAEAFKQVAASRDAFSTILDRLIRGGEVAGERVPASPDRIQPALETLQQEWRKTEQNASTLLKEQKNLVGLGAAVAQVNGSNPQLLDLAERVQALKLQNAASTREISTSGQLVMLTQRLAKNANALLAGETVDSEVAFLLGKDTNEFRTLLAALREGNAQLRIPPAKDPEIVARLEDLATAFKTYQDSASAILGNMQRLIAAKNAAAAIFADSEKLLQATERVAGEYDAALAGSGVIYLVLLLGLATVVVSALIAVDFVRDEQRRREEAERQQATVRRQNEQNQAAILRLMNEMQDFAEGDLTVRATVSEDITGAVADSVNFAIEELRTLVGRITTAADQVTVASDSAQQTSSQLLAANDKQSQEIKNTSAQVLGMARTINDVSSSATQSADVARASLAAAEKGQEAVQNAISGMNGIRDQIQETAKRIKRLGESSQEIGEIVELISDITEQTNVLALNAAIQAASAGEAGRGFTVVAEEVQRLAERSGEATKQIGAIVKTIQTDTQDAVTAMERSTQGVVAGAKLSDNAGQALAEIGDVSRKLAELIETISQTTQTQAKSAGAVAVSMRNILGITEQATEGTKRTAQSIGQLATLARDLKSSVANFKL